MVSASRSSAWCSSTAGSEVGGGDVRREVGTVARILEVRAFPDGRFALADRRVCAASGSTTGSTTTRIPGPTSRSGPTRTRASSCRSGSRICACASAASVPWPRSSAARAAPLDAELAPDPVLASYQLVALSPVGPDDAYRLLGCPGPADRLDRLDALLVEVEEVLRFRLGDGDG